MVDFKTLDDIEKERENKSREDMKKNIVKDINDVFGNVIKKRKEETEKRKKKRKWWVKLILALLILGLLLLVINFVLGNIWLLKFFIKDLFYSK
jgi:flagellar basal body-associated protein FliL